MLHLTHTQQMLLDAWYGSCKCKKSGEERKRMKKKLIAKLVTFCQFFMGPHKKRENKKKKLLWQSSPATTAAPEFPQKLEQARRPPLKRSLKTVKTKLM